MRGGRVFWTRAHLGELRDPLDDTPALEIETDEIFQRECLGIEQEELERFRKRHRYRYSAPMSSKPAPSAANAKPNLFQQMDDLTWEEVTITLISDTVARPAARTRQENATYIELGFKNRREAEATPIKAWKFFMQLADDSGTHPYQPATRQYIKDIRSRLRAFFGIDDNPFYPYQNGRWEPRFRFRQTALVVKRPFIDENDAAGLWLEDHKS